MLARVTAGDPHAPQVVLTHGVGDHAAGFASLIDALSPRFSVTALDHRGHGHSPRFTPAQLTDPFPVLVADFVAELERLRRPLVYGHSMGASVAAAAASAHPELVAGLILEDPPWVDRSEEESLLIGEARVAAVAHECRDLPAAITRQVAAGWSVPEAAAWAAGRPLVQPEFLATGVVRAAGSWRKEVDALVDKRINVLVLAGTMVDPAEVVGLDVLGIKGAGHNIRRTRTGETMAAIEKMLGRHT